MRWAVYPFIYTHEFYHTEEGKYFVQEYKCGETKNMRKRYLSYPISHKAKKIFNIFIYPSTEF